MSQKNRAANIVQTGKRIPIHLINVISLPMTRSSFINVKVRVGLEMKLIDKGYITFS